MKKEAHINMAEPQESDRITFCAECGYTGEYNEVIQHFQDNHEVQNDGSTVTNAEITVIEAQNITSEEPLDTNLDLDNERNIIQWTKESEARLLELVKEKAAEFNSPYMRKKQLWKIISDELASRYNINATALQCDNKWKSVSRKLRKKDKPKSPVDNVNKSMNLKLALIEQDQVSNDIAEPQIDQEEISQICVKPSSSSSKEMPTNSPKKQVIYLKRQRESSSIEEPRWFKQFRVECQKRHEERIELQNKLLEQHRNLMMQLILTMANMKK